MIRLALLLTLAATAPAAAAAAQSAGDTTRGAKLYVANGCYACHGTRGNGGGVAGPPIAPPIAVEAFTRQMRQPVQRMPAFSERLLSSADIADIIAFLRTTPKGKGPADIPLLREPA